MRRRERIECTWNGATWVTNDIVHYVYDGNLVLQERHYTGPQVATSPQLITYTRGLDLSGSLQGAGGIGGLLARSDMANVQNPHAYYHADGNGNVTCLVNSRSAIVAKYIYDPYGNMIAASGPLADVNLYRFSSKEFHPQSGLVYYLYRYYEPNLQRWLNRDPIGELGHRNLRGSCVTCYRAFATDGGTFRFCDNIPTLEYDSFGLLTKEDCDDEKDRADKKAAAAGLQCLFNAAAEGIIGEVIIGGGLTIIGAIVGKVPGAGTGLVVGTGLNLVLDICHLRACERKVDRMKHDAKDAYDACLKKVDK